MQSFYVTSHQQLTELCDQFAKAEHLAIDTEFVRTRTLFPKLGLIQISDGQTIALVDPVEIHDLSPVWQLLEDESLVKVIHACPEDLEVFLTWGDCQPANLIDSQIMASFLGHGLSVGYATLVDHYLNIRLDKSDSRTDWTKRPLSESQLRYAEADVTHLHKLYPLLLADIRKTPWEQAAKQETQALINKKFTPILLDELYQSVKMSWKLSPKQLNNLKFLASWRYQQAVEKDRPIGFIAKEHTIINVAMRSPKSVGAMANIEGVDVLDVRHKGKAMLSVLRKADNVEPEQYPEKIRRLDEYPGYKQLFKKVKNFISKQAETIGLAPEVCASKKQINQLMSAYYNNNLPEGETNQIDLLFGWRYLSFGEVLLKHAKSRFSELT